MADVEHTIDVDRSLAVARKFLPHLDTDASEVAIASPGEGEGFWNGAPSAVEYDGVIYLAYRTRQPIELGRGQGVVIAKSEDGVQFETIQTIDKASMDAESLERPTLIRTMEGKWRLYLSCATTGTKHWRVELLEADSPEAFDPATRTVVMPGSDHWAVKDTVISRHSNMWHCWATFHPLDIPEQEDRMVSRYATSQDGIKWEWSSAVCLEPRHEMWDSRGARITAVVPTKDAWIAFYDGRAGAEENYEERTGIAFGASPEHFDAIGEQPFGQSMDGKGLRYLDVVPLSTGGYRTYYEVATPNGSHELRTELIENN
jgi:hypothetical protein